MVAMCLDWLQSLKQFFINMSYHILLASLTLMALFLNCQSSLLCVLLKKNKCMCIYFFMNTSILMSGSMESL